MKLTVRQLKNLIKESVKQTLLEYSEDEYSEDSEELERYISGKLENAKMGQLVPWSEFEPKSKYDTKYTKEQIEEEIKTNATFQKDGPFEAEVEEGGVRKVEPRY